MCLCRVKRREETHNSASVPLSSVLCRGEVNSRLLSQGYSSKPGEGGGLVCESVGKAALLSDYFDSKQSREAVHLPIACHVSPSRTTFAFRSSEVRRLLL